MVAIILVMQFVTNQNIYQNNEYCLNGEKNCDAKEYDEFINVDSIDSTEPNHTAIDDSNAVQRKVYKFINN